MKEIPESLRNYLKEPPVVKKKGVLQTVGGWVKQVVKMYKDWRDEGKNLPREHVN